MTLTPALEQAMTNAALPLPDLEVADPLVHAAPPTFERRRTWGSLSDCLVPASRFGHEARAIPCPAGPGGAIMVRRMRAVMPTAMAPATAKTTCQVADGMVSFTMPKVAW